MGEQPQMKTMAQTGEGVATVETDQNKEQMEAA
jgi:hypothetical protein